MAFGKPLNTIYRFDRADVIVSLDSDFLCSTTPGSLRYARDYSARRRAAAENPDKSPPRLYVAENTPSITGSMADHHVRMTAGGVTAFAFYGTFTSEQPGHGNLTGVGHSYIRPPEQMWRTL